MSDIVNKMLQEIINRSNAFEEQTKGTKDEYNIYREHIQYVYTDNLEKCDESRVQVLVNMILDH